MGGRPIRPMPIWADTPRCRCTTDNTPPAPFQAHLRNKSAKEPSTPTPIHPRNGARGQAASPICSPHPQKQRRGSRDGNLSSMIHQNSDNCPSSFGFGGAKTPMIKYGSGAFFMCHSYDVPRKRYKSSSAIFKYFSLTFSHATPSSWYL